MMKQIPRQNLCAWLCLFAWFCTLHDCFASRRISLPTRTEQMITEIGDKQMVIVQQGYEMAKFLNGLLVSPQSMLSKIAWAFYTGDKELLETALHGSESHRQLFQMACEAITETRKEWEGGTEGQKGYITGRIVGEVLTLLIPAGAAGTTSCWLVTIGFLRQLLRAGYWQTSESTSMRQPMGVFSQPNPSL